jgi:ribosomal protein S18 acetylase RimI-like enzyme
MADKNIAVDIRPLEVWDVKVVRWTLYTAVSWSGNPKIPAMDQALQHPQLVIYHEGWGRPGDFGVIASVDGDFAGAALARLFTEVEHGDGYVNPDTPELGVAVEPMFRGRGIGRHLMNALADMARERGIAQLSLSVNNPNPAKRLYESLGYTTTSDNTDSSVMVLPL